jgi:hypothetical protein
VHAQSLRITSVPVGHVFWTRAPPSITLDVYSHLFKPSDGGAAAVFDKALGGLQAE